MPTGTKTDLNVRNPFLHTALTERLTQFSDAFNEASNGAISLTTESMIGEADHSTAFRNISSLITRRDTTSTDDATSQKLVNSEKTRVKLDRSIGPVDNALSGFRKIGMDADEMQIVVGEQAGKAIAIDMLNEGLGAVRAALVSGGTTLHAHAGPLATAELVKGLYKFGDAADRVVVWLMHSFVYSQLIQQQIAANIDGVSNFNVSTATPVTLNRPVIVSDSEALVTTDGAGAGNDHYFTLGLTAGALELINSEEEEVIFEVVTGKKNLIARIQGEFAYTVGMTGFSYDLTNGGVNPNTAALRTGTNWDSVVDSHKDWPGVVIRTQTSA